MTTYKTTSGLMTAAAELAAELEANSLRDSDSRDVAIGEKKVKSLLGQLDAAWSNPADAADAAKARRRLADAWTVAVS